MGNEFRLTLQTQNVLAVLLRAPKDDHYGFEIVKAARLSSGSVYPILARLEKAGWVTSDWENIDESAAGRRRRRNYRLTGLGLSKSRQVVEEARRMLPDLQGAPA